MPNYGGFPPYVSVAQRRAKAQKAIGDLRKKNPDIAPIVIEGNKLARTWWGKAWNDNLERYSDYANRIGRGRSYVRHGAVLDLKIEARKITALVQGSATTPYKVTITIAPLDKTMWETITKQCEGEIDSLQELLDGKFPKALAASFMEKGKGLFPDPKQISLHCGCPDWATMCKHVAAVLYGVGARLDENPGLFFVLRDVNIDDLVAKAVTEKSETLLRKSARTSRRVIASDDISDMFGIEIDVDNAPASPDAAAKTGYSKQKSARARTPKPK